MSIENYIEYVQSQIEVYKKYAEFGSSVSELSPMDVNTALYEYTSVNIMINAEYQRIKYEFSQFMKRYTLWWDKRFTETRRELNPISIAASKWLSKQEIESETRVKFEEEFLKWENEKDDLELRLSFMRSLREDWKQQGNLIVNLGQNMRNELSSLSIDSRINRNIRRTRQL